MKLYALAPLLLVLLLALACAAPLPAPGVSYDVTCRVTVDSVSATSSTTHQTCSLVPTPTPTPVSGSQVTVIQPTDPVGFLWETVCTPPNNAHSDETMHDAWVAQVVPEVQWGRICNVPQATYKLFVGFVSPDNGEYRSLLRFPDLTGAGAIPANAVIDQVVLTVKQTFCQGSVTIPVGCTGEDITIEAHQVTSYWHEWGTRWMDMPTYDAAPLSSVTVTNVLGATLNLDITQAYKSWRLGAPNNGVILIANPLPSNGFFRGRSHDTVCNADGSCSGGQGTAPGVDGPKLTVTWHLP